MFKKLDQWSFNQAFDFHTQNGFSFDIKAGANQLNNRYIVGLQKCSQSSLLICAKVNNFKFDYDNDL